MKDKIYIQGDVVLKRIEGLPQGKQILEKFVLAYGELTGHQHKLIESDGVKVIKILDKLYVNLLKETTLRHGKKNEMMEPYIERIPGVLRHLDLKVPKGIYEVIIQRETDHYLQETRKVVD